MAESPMVFRQSKLCELPQRSKEPGDAQTGRSSRGGFPRELLRIQGGAREGTVLHTWGKRQGGWGSQVWAESSNGAWGPSGLEKAEEATASWRLHSMEEDYNPPPPS